MFFAVLSVGVYGQQNDTMFVHRGQTIYEFAVQEVDSVVFYRTQERMVLPVDTVLIVDTVIISDTIVVVNTVIVVRDIAATSVMLDRRTVTLVLGDTLRLTATVLPIHATNRAVTWESSDANIATVDYRNHRGWRLCTYSCCNRIHTGSYRSKHCNFCTGSGCKNY
jgi:hypothetical protein